MRGLVVDLFAGGGGASTGIERALGRPVDIAVNHSETAIAMHERNHPQTTHYRADVWAVPPREACGGRPVRLLWLSPACTHFSRASGGQNPKSAQVRSLASVAIRWARDVRPAVIMLENVEEFLGWGPLDNHGRPVASKAGRSFRVWLGKLRAQGYTVEWRSLVAADYGAPTTRRRLYLIARCDGQPIVWPARTHGVGRGNPWRTAAECLDWSLPCPSIFDRKRPLAEATLRRIAAGVMRFVVNNPTPFITALTHHGAPRVHSLSEPLRTVTTANRGEFALVAPSLTKFYGTAQDGSSVEAPAPTVTASGQHIGIVAPTLVSHYGQSVGRAVNEPAPTVTAGGQGHTALAAASLVQMGYGERQGQAPRALDIAQPLGTVVAGGAKHAAVAEFLTKHFGGVVGQKIDAPASTVTAKDHHALTSVTLGAGDRREDVQAFLLKYYGSGTQHQRTSDPLHTITTRARFGLVIVEGVEYAISDIGMRMLAPHELWRAQGFPDDLDVKGLTKTQQIQLCGNSVCPPVADALVRANIVDADEARRVA